MMSSPVKTRRSWIRWIINTNPFYLCSVALVLYGIQLSFDKADHLGEDWAWLLIRLLSGYTLALAVVGLIIVRLAQVWDDARTVLLLVLLLLIAMSASFDRVCLDDTRQAISLLVAGLAFAIGLCEVLIAMLPLRLSIWFRLPLYVQFVLVEFHQQSVLLGQEFLTAGIELLGAGFALSCWKGRVGSRGTAILARWSRILVGRPPAPDS